MIWPFTSDEKKWETVRKMRYGFSYVLLEQRCTKTGDARGVVVADDYRRVVQAEWAQMYLDEAKVQYSAVTTL